MSAFFGLRWRGSWLADQEVSLPHSLRLPGLEGGTDTMERAFCAWELGQSLPEFEDRSQDQQDWLLAVYRTKRKVERILSILRLTEKE